LGASLIEGGHDVSLIDGELIGAKYGKPLNKNEKLFTLLRPLRMMPGKRHRIYNEAMTSPDHPVWHDMVKKIEKTNPRVVGITTYTSAMTGVKHLCKILKRKLDIPIVLGGVHATALPERTLKETGADAIIRGEGEQLFLKAVEEFSVGRTIPPVISTNPLNDLDILPLPARHLLKDYRLYTTNIITSRGCPYDCVFCASDTMWGKKVRFRSPKNILTEIDELVEKYKIRGFRFCDDTFTLNKKRVLNICAELRMRDYDVVFSCGTRADTMDSDIAKFLKNAKCHTVSMGVESGNQGVLNDIKKGITKDDVIHTVQILKKAGILVYTFFMVGHQKDSKETIRETINFMKQLDPDIVEVNIMTPYPGTEAWSSKYENIEWYHFFHQDAGIISTDFLTREEVSKEFVKAYKVFAIHSLKKTVSRRFFR